MFQMVTQAETYKDPEDLRPVTATLAWRNTGESGGPSWGGGGGGGGLLGLGAFWADPENDFEIRQTPQKEQPSCQTHITLHRDGGGTIQMA